MSYYRQQLEDFLKTLDLKAHTVADVGGAQGEAIARLKSLKCEKYCVFDLPEYNLDDYCSWPLRADLVFCLEVFDYIKNPARAFANLSRLLKHGGTMYVTFPFVYPHHNELEAEGLRYSEPAIRWLTEAYTDLTIENITYRKDKSGLLQAFYSADGMRRAKEYPEHDVTGFIVEFTK